MVDRVDRWRTSIPDVAMLEITILGDSDFFFAKKYILLPSIEYKATLYVSSRGYVSEIRVWIFTLSDH